MTNIIRMSDDPAMFRIVEPSPISFSGRAGLGVYTYADGSVVICVGSDADVPAQTLMVEPELIGSLWRTLRAIEEGDNEPR